MKISKLQKEVIHSNPSVRITVEITVEAEDLADFDYSGYDLIPDELIPDILVAVGKTYRIKKGKLNAKKDSRPLIDSDVKTACQQACPTNAIVFGNVNDKESAIRKVRTKEEEGSQRTFYVLEQIHVLPNVSYMAKVRNTERTVGNHEEAHEAAHTEKEKAGHH
jgi:hypothetical protein